MASLDETQIVSTSEPLTICLKGNKLFFNFNVSDLKDTYYGNFHHFTDGNTDYYQCDMAGDKILVIYKKVIEYCREQKMDEDLQDKMERRFIKTVNGFGGISMIDNLCSFMDYIGDESRGPSFDNLIKSYFSDYFGNKYFGQVDISLVNEKIKYYDSFVNKVFVTNFVDMFMYKYVRRVAMVVNDNYCFNLFTDISSMPESSHKDKIYYYLTSCVFTPYTFTVYNRNDYRLNPDNIIRGIPLDKAVNVLLDSRSLLFIYRYSEINNIPLSELFKLVPNSDITDFMVDNIAVMKLSQITKVFTAVSDEMKEQLEEAYEHIKNGTF